MKRILMSFCILTAAAGIARGQDIVVTTSVISSVVKDITGDRIRVETLVPSGSCPGHFDLNVRHLRLMEKTGILFAHGFEEYLEDIRRSVRNPGFTVSIIRVEGNWLVPASQREAYEKTAKILSGMFPEHAGYFDKNMKDAEAAIDRTDRAIKTLIKEKRISGLKVACNDHISEMLEYMGFAVAATYGRQEELTPPLVRKLINTCRKENVRLVIDNLQAGPDTGKIVSGELGIPHLAISNFPGVFPGTSTLRETLYENARRIVTVYEKFKNQVD